MFVEKLVQSLIKRWTHPIHSIIYNIFNRCMPSVVFREKVSIVDYVKNCVTVLESPKIIYFTITHTQNQITCSSRSFQPVYWLIESCIPLQNVSEHESERIAKTTLLTKGFIDEIYTYFADGHFVRIDSWDDSKPSIKTDIKPSISILFAGRMVNGDKRVFPKGTIDILDYRIFTQSKALSCIAFPSGVAFPQAPNIEHVPLVNSPIMWILRINFRETPLASAIPRISS